LSVDGLAHLVSVLQNGTEIGAYIGIVVDNQNGS
jgi:hypothetical protein